MQGMTGQDVKNIRVEFGLTVREFAKKIDVTFGSIYNWEGGGNIQFATQRRIEIWVIQKRKAKHEKIKHD